jgi:hypothetical protein
MQTVLVSLDEKLLAGIGPMGDYLLLPLYGRLTQPIRGASTGDDPYPVE